MPTLYLIDGYAQFFRAYHAIRTPMTSPVTGEPTNLTFGFVGMLLKILRGEGKAGDGAKGRPDMLAVALDVSGDRGTFRSTIYPQYKATRPPPPEDLPRQVQRCLDLLRAIGAPVIGSEGFEADDVIATIAARLAGKGVLVRAVSKDKDLKQLLACGEFELHDVHTDELTTAESFETSTGLKPSQVIDMLTLMGDTVDNVPGVEGVGEKTAIKLLQEHGDLDALLRASGTIKGKRGEKLREAADRLPLSRELVTLRADAPIKFDADACRIETLKLEALMPILKELGFNRYQDELRALLADPESASTSTRTDSAHGTLFASPSTPSDKPSITGVAGLTTRVVRTAEDLAELCEALQAASLYAIDTETTSIRPMLADLVGLSFAVREGEGWYAPVRSPEPGEHLDERTVLDALRPILEDPTRPICGHNLKYDMLVLRRAGVELAGVQHPEMCDTMVASYLIDASRSSHSLDALSQALLNHQTISIRELIGSGKNQKTFDTVPLDQASVYAAEDAEVSLRLRNIMAPQLRAMNLESLMRTLEAPLISVLAELEFNGVLLDPDELDRQRERLQIRIGELKSSIDDEAMRACGRTFDPDSPRQLAGILFNKPQHEDPGLGLRPLKRGKTGPSTDAEVLEKLSLDTTIETSLPRLVLDYRQLTKLVNTYLLSLKAEIHPQTRRVHASFNQTVAATGRLSSSDPNLQNIPIRSDVGREIRRAFVAPPGRVLVTADYSQIELRLLAHLSKDPALTEAFIAGADIHTAVAAQIHGVPEAEVTREQRDGAKMVNFGIVYGITPFGLARRLGVGNKEAEEIITNYKRRFAGITTFLEECVQQAESRGYVETMLGRRRPIPEIESTNPARRALAHRMAINSVVQGSAADLIKIAMVDLHSRLSPHAAHAREGREPEIPGVLMLLQIHDELVFEADASDAEQARNLIVERMEAAMRLTVPLVAEAATAPNWFEGK